MTSRVLLTRAPSVSRELTGLLRERGYTVSAAPLLEAQMPADTTELREVLELAVHPRVPTWLVVTSANTVAALGRVADDPRWGRSLDVARAGSPALRVAAVGTATARCVREAGIGVDFTPEGEQSAAGLLAQWPEPYPPHDALALLPASELASPRLARGLAQRGYRAVTATAYRMVPVPAPDPLVLETVLAGDPPVLSADVARRDCAQSRFHAVVATAPSRVAALLDGVPPPAGTRWVAIGEPTAHALRERGIAPVVARDPSPAALTDAVDQAIGTAGGRDVAPARATHSTRPMTACSTEENLP